MEIVQSLGKDPSLRLSQSGRELLRWLGFQARATVDWEKRVEAVPAHCVPTVAQMAAACAQEWLEIARRLESKAREDESGQTPSTDQPRGARPSDRFAQLDKHDAPQLALAPRTRQA